MQKETQSIWSDEHSSSSVYHKDSYNTDCHSGGIISKMIFHYHHNKLKVMTINFETFYGFHFGDMFSKLEISEEDTGAVGKCFWKS